MSKEDRRDYEEGRRDSHKGVFETVFNDVFVNHPTSDAYYEGRTEKDSDED